MDDPNAQPQPAANYDNTAGANQQYIAPPPMPPAQQAADPSTSFVRYTRHPETAQWENAQWSLNQYGPGRPGVTFGDGKTFDVEASKIEHANANTGVPANEAQQPLQPLNLLKSDYETFKQILVRLDEQSQALFELPLDVLLTMVHRHATQQGLEGAGKMGTYSGLAQFVPNKNTLNEWVFAYLSEIQRREAAKAMPEA